MLITGDRVVVQPLWPDWAGSLAPGTFLDQPSSRLEYLNTEEQVQWARFLAEFTDDTFRIEPNELISGPTRFQGGRTYPEARNFAVFSPGFAQPLEGTRCLAARVTYST